MNNEWKTTSDFKAPEKSPGFLLWKVSTEWRRKVETTLKTLNLTHPQFVLLANLSWLTSNKIQLTQIELARHLSIDITMTSQILRLLEKKGYVERKKKEGDERSNLPFLTESGILLAKKAIPLVESVDRDFFNKLEKDTPKCIEILKKLL